MYNYKFWISEIYGIIVTYAYCVVVIVHCDMMDNSIVDLFFIKEEMCTVITLQTSM